MIDIEFIKRKIYKPDENQFKIAPGDEIPLEVVNILRDGQYMDRKECFGVADARVPYIVHLNCSECDAVTVSPMSKAGMLEYLSSKRRVLCDDCKQKEETVKARRIIQAKKNDARICEQEQLAKTQMVEKYATPTDESFSQDELLQIFYNVEKFVYGDDIERIKNAIVDLSYKDFLRTPYWKAVSYYAKRKAGFACQICNSKQNLATHHKTYERHGFEHFEIGRDLIVLCKDCHDKFHDKLATL